MNIPPEDEQILQLLFEVGGVVAGGYIRDIIAWVTPNDIDIVIPDAGFELFTQSLTSLGYTRSEDADVETDFLFISEQGKPIEGIILDRRPGVSARGFLEDAVPGEYLGFPTSPDFDVNLLAFDGDRLYNWMSLGDMPSLWVPNIISRILRRETLMSSEPVSSDRIDKMLAKGYRIVGHFGEPEY